MWIRTGNPQKTGNHTAFWVWSQLCIILDVPPAPPTHTLSGLWIFMSAPLSLRNHENQNWNFPHWQKFQRKMPFITSLTFLGPYNHFKFGLDLPYYLISYSILLRWKMKTKIFSFFSHFHWEGRSNVQNAGVLKRKQKHNEIKNCSL